jgi:hypothetical protein
MGKKLKLAILKFFKNCDIFGQPISLMYKGEKKFKTHVGGVVTFMFAFALVFYFVYLAYVMISRNTISVNTITKRKDLTNESREHFVSDYDFFIAVGIEGINNSFNDHELRQYYEISVGNFERVRKDSNISIEKVKDLELEPWGMEFPLENKAIVVSNNLQNYMCVKPSNRYGLKGNFYNEVFRYVNITLSMWNNSTYANNWKSREEIEAYTLYKRFNIIMMNRFFELDNFDMPVQEFLTQEMTYEMVSSILKSDYIYLKENKVKLMDNFFQYGDHKEETFYSVSSNKVDFGYNNYTYIQGFIGLDSETIEHKRTIYSFLDALAQIGGVYGVVGSSLAFVFGYYVDKMRDYWVIRNWYQIRTNGEDDNPVYHNNEKDTYWKELGINPRLVNKKQRKDSIARIIIPQSQTKIFK